MRAAFRVALLPVLAALALPVPGARAAALPAAWTVTATGARGGEVYGGPAVDGVGAVYVPARVSAGRRLRVAYVLGPGDPGTLARSLGVAGIGDQLSWQQTTPPFAVVVSSASSGPALARAVHFAEGALPLTRAAPGRVVIGLGSRAGTALGSLLLPRLRIGTGIAIGGRVPHALLQRVALERAPHRVRTYAAAAPGSPAAPPQWHQQLQSALAYAFSTPSASRAVAGASAVAPAGWTDIAAGPAGGTIWQGVIPDHADPGHPRASLVYLPPGARRGARYPALYLLHGLRGSPYSFVGGLRLAAVADGLIQARQVRPFIAVMPPAGSTPQFDGEWTGAWETYVVRDVMPWAERHLPVTRTPRDRTLAGFSAGAYGAVDIALRHPGLFGTLESWSGYFTAPRDGSLAGATPAERRAHDPQALVRAQAAALRAAHVRFFLSAGRRERITLAATRAFARELAALGLEHAVHVGGGGHHGSTWRAVLPAGVRYALTR
jgi:enterochelin esterase-like enzyme